MIYLSKMVIFQFATNNQRVSLSIFPARGDDKILHCGVVEKTQGDIRRHPEAKSVTPQALVQAFSWP